MMWEYNGDLRPWHDCQHIATTYRSGKKWGQSGKWNKVKGEI